MYADVYPHGSFAGIESPYAYPHAALEGCCGGQRMGDLGVPIPRGATMPSRHRYGAAIPRGFTTRHHHYGDLGLPIQRGATMPSRHHYGDLGLPVPRGAVTPHRDRSLGDVGQDAAVTYWLGPPDLRERIDTLLARVETVLAGWQERNPESPWTTTLVSTRVSLNELSADLDGVDELILAGLEATDPGVEGVMANQVDRYRQLESKVAQAEASFSGAGGGVEGLGLPGWVWVAGVLSAWAIFGARGSFSLRR